MKKILFGMAALFVMTGFAAAQAYVGTVEYDKKKHRALIAEYPYPPEVVEAAILQRMEKSGHRAREEKGLFNSDKGVKVYKGEYLDDIHPDRMDYVIKVERKSKKEPDQSIVYLIMLKDGANHLEHLVEENLLKAKSFLNNMHPHIESSHLELKIKNQQDVVTKAEKKMKKLQEEKQQMEEKIQKLQQSLEENAKQQEETAKDMELQQQALEGLKAKRKS